jgi:hypothetical protein
MQAIAQPLIVPHDFSLPPRYPCCSISHSESRVSTPSVTLNERSVLWRSILRTEQVLVTIGFVVYALLVSINQPASLFIIMIATLTVGNLVIPLAFASRRLYVTRPFPWNWVAFFPVQIVIGVICAVGSILFLQLTKIEPEPFSLLFTKIGYFAIVVVLIATGVGFGVEEFQRKLKERNQLLEQTVEKGDHRAAAAGRGTQAGARDSANAAAQHIAAACRSSDRRRVAACARSRWRLLRRDSTRQRSRRHLHRRCRWKRDHGGVAHGESPGLVSRLRHHRGIA